MIKIRPFKKSDAGTIASTPGYKPIVLNGANSDPYVREQVKRLNENVQKIIETQEQLKSAVEDIKSQEKMEEEPQDLATKDDFNDFITKTKDEFKKYQDLTNAEKRKNVKRFFGLYAK